MQTKITKIDCCFIVVNQKAFSLFSLLFNVKSGLIVIQKLVFIHNPGDIYGQVDLFCCKTEIFLSFSFLLTEQSQDFSSETIRIDPGLVMSFFAVI